MQPQLPIGLPVRDPGILRGRDGHRVQVRKPADLEVPVNVRQGSGADVVSDPTGRIDVQQSKRHGPHRAASPVVAAGGERTG